MIIAGQIIYSFRGWIVARHHGQCGLCGATISPGQDILRVSAGAGPQYAGTCCAVVAEDLSGHWLLRPGAPRRSGGAS